MVSESVKAQLDAAKQSCSEEGRGLTPKRRQVLEVLLTEGVPMSAYEITKLMNARNKEKTQAMSTYRILEFLCSVKLVHRLASKNQFIACAGTNHHSVDTTTVFLLCEHCRAVEEVTLPPALSEHLTQLGNRKRFTFSAPQIELRGCCASCATGPEEPQ